MYKNDDEIQRMLEGPQGNEKEAELRDEHRSLGSFSLYNQYNLANLVFHMKKHASIMQKCVESKDIQYEVYGSKTDFTNYIYYLTLTYLRGIRAFHFKNRIEEQEAHDKDDPKMQKVIKKIKE